MGYVMSGGGGSMVISMDCLRGSGARGVGIVVSASGSGSPGERREGMEESSGAIVVASKWVITAMILDAAVVVVMRSSLTSSNLGVVIGVSPRVVKISRELGGSVVNASLEDCA